MNKSKGFTIIELLVVVAIIAVLAAIVLVNVTQYINQGKNAAIKGNLTTMLTNAAVYYDTNGHYADWLTSSGYTAPHDAANAANAGAGDTVVEGCNDADCADETTTPPTAWCACSPIYATSTETGTFCVDSTGFKGVTATACGGVGGRCLSGAGGTNGACQP